jgi:hypothetical protein
MNSLKNKLSSLSQRLKDRAQTMKDAFIVEVKVLSAGVSAALKEHMLSGLDRIPTHIPSPQEKIPLPGTDPEAFSKVLRQGVERDKETFSDLKSDLEVTKKKLKKMKRKSSKSKQ